MSTNGRPMLPPRWLKCPRKGELVADLFLPFKTPLDSRYDNLVPLVNRFSMDMLMASSRQYFTLGMIIDLTNTTRFYDRKEVESYDCKYVKLRCQGHHEAPTPEQTQIFIEIVSSFLDWNPDKKIGIHCTHGFNRTGLLIIAYLVEKLDWSVDTAVEHFAQCRPPGIYKHDYLETLFHRYDDVSDCPPAPPLPDWCIEDDDDDDDDDGGGGGGGEAEAEAEAVLSQSVGGAAGGSSETGSSGGGECSAPKRARLIHGPGGQPVLPKEPKFMDGVAGVSAVTDLQKMERIQKKVAGFCEWHRTNVFPGSQPVSMDRQNIKYLAETNYVVSWKADGTRYLMVCLGEGEIYLLDRDNCVYHAPTVRFVHRKDLGTHLSEVLMDGELIIDKVDGQSIPRFLIYDIIRFEGCPVGKCEFQRRCVCIERELIAPRTQLMKDGRLDKSREPFSVRQKHFWPLNTIRKILDGDFARQMSHEVDGLIFQPAHVRFPYKCGTFPHLLKWKPPEMNTVDFQLKLVTETREACLPETRGYLYVGGLDRPFSWMPTSRRALRQYDGKIIECCYDAKDNCWKFLRQREDKSFPNHFSVAQAIVESIRAPVTKDFLYNFVDALVTGSGNFVVPTGTAPRAVRP